MYKYGRIHFLATGKQARNERYPTAIMEFIESLNPKLMRALAKKACRSKDKTPDAAASLQHGRGGV